MNTNSFKVGEAGMLNPNISKLYLTTVLALGVGHKYFHSEVPQRKMFNDFGSLGNTALRTAASCVYTRTQCSGRTRKQFLLAGQDEATKCILFLDPVRAPLVLTQRFSTLAAP